MRGSLRRWAAVMLGAAAIGAATPAVAGAAVLSTSTRSGDARVDLALTSGDVLTVDVRSTTTPLSLTMLVPDMEGDWVTTRPIAPIGRTRIVARRGGVYPLIVRAADGAEDGRYVVATRVQRALRMTVRATRTADGRIAVRLAARDGRYARPGVSARILVRRPGGSWTAIGRAATSARALRSLPAGLGHGPIQIMARHAATDSTLPASATAVVR